MLALRCVKFGNGVKTNTASFLHGIVQNCQKQVERSNHNILNYYIPSVMEIKRYKSPH